jgi:hypothetical protein
MPSETASTPSSTNTISYPTPSSTVSGATPSSTITNGVSPTPSEIAGQTNGSENTSGTIVTQIFVDDNKNNVMDVNEQPIPGVSVTITDINGNIVTKTTTNNVGQVVVEDVVEGTYTVEISTTGYETSKVTTTVISNQITYVNVPFPSLPGVSGGVGPTPSAPTPMTTGNTPPTPQDNYSPTLQGGTGPTPLTTTIVNSSPTPAGSTSGITPQGGTGPTPSTTGNTSPSTQNNDSSTPQGGTGPTPSTSTIGNTTPSTQNNDSSTPQGGTEPTPSSIGNTSPTNQINVQDTGTIVTQIYLDTNKNNAMDINETPVNGVSVTIKDSYSSTVTKSTTNNMGQVIVQNLVVGTYTVFIDVTGYETKEIFTTVITNEITYVNVPLDSMPDLSGGSGPTPSPQPGREGDTPSSNMSETGIVIGTAFNDSNGDGVQYNSEVTIINTTTKETVFKTTTDAKGYWSSTSITVGSYDVVYSVPLGYVATTYDNGVIPNVTVAPGETYWMPCGFKPSPGVTGTIAVVVCTDMNGDGACSDADTPTSGILVTVYPEGSIVPTTTANTGPDGIATFDLPPGLYDVVVQPPPAQLFAGPDFEPTGTANAPVTVTPGSFIKLNAPVAPSGSIQGTLNVNGNPTGSIEGTVWLDSNGDGKKGSSDTGMADVPVHLGSDGKVLNTTSTDTNGYYIFSGIEGTVTYTITVDNPNTDYFAFFNMTGPDNGVNNFGAGEVDVEDGDKVKLNAGMELKPGTKTDYCTSNDKALPSSPCHFVTTGGGLFRE